MKQQFTYMATAVMFLTRIPVGNAGSGNPDDLAASTQYFPLVGVLVGILVSVVFLLTNALWNPGISIVFVLISAVLITGGFHEDGLADVADSAGAWTSEQKLEVMRDSRIGTYGGLALILMMLLKFSALTTLAELVDTDSVAVDGEGSRISLGVIVATFILAHVLGRWSTLPLVRLTPYARTNSSNSVFAEGVTNQRLLFGSAIAFVVMALCSLVLGSAVVAALLLSVVVMVLSRLWYMRSIGGITGDCLGATNQAVEVAVYLSVAGLLI